MVDGARDTETKAAETSDFRCPSCGGRMEFDAARGALLCEACGATRAIGEDDVERTIVEYDLERGLALSAERGFGAAVRRVACEQCGAVVNYAESETARRCDFCGSPQVVAREQNQQPIRPESVLPFQIDRAAAATRFSSWLGGLWLRPSNLKKLASVSEMTGMYVPYWVFDASVHSDWTALAGYYYYVEETYTTTDDRGRSVQRRRRVQKVRWQPAWGSRDDIYDDLLVCGSRGLPPDLTHELEPFDTKVLRRYDPSFLAGWRAEEYNLDLNAAWKLGVDRMTETQRARCSGDVPGDTQQALRVVNRFADEKFKHVLLPIWISVYRYKDKPYRFLVNGQTGEVSGHAPWSIFKIGLLCVVLAVLAYFILKTQR
ncbi:MAG TPA: TFIIB-type zinc ribbon-containing protein [Polyangiaceae bacterium]|nr:TFIIB-type zinc ribbon-containing protein [Polyangiaceae bacterium]